MKWIQVLLPPLMLCAGWGMLGHQAVSAPAPPPLDNVARVFNALERADSLKLCSRAPFAGDPSVMGTVTLRGADKARVVETLKASVGCEFTGPACRAPRHTVTVAGVVTLAICPEDAQLYAQFADHSPPVQLSLRDSGPAIFYEIKKHRNSIEQFSRGKVVR